jgi:acyl carrier protein
VSDLQPLRELSFEQFRAVLRPKVAGTWVLHELTLTRDRPLDFFVLFSSAASVWGSRDAAHYVAANHFMDAVAHHRHALGLPALSVNWGWWAGSTMVSAELQRYFSALGLDVLPAQQGLDALACLLESDSVERTVAVVDWSRFKPIYAAKRRRPFLDEIESRPTFGAGAPADGQGRLRRLLDEAPPERRWEILVGSVQQAVGRILSLDDAEPVSLTQGFFQMGMDSIMSVQLKTELEIGLGEELPSTLAFDCPTVESLCRFLVDEVLGSDSLAPATPRPVDQEVEDASEEELVALLAAELENRGPIVGVGHDVT